MRSAGSGSVLWSKHYVASVVDAIFEIDRRSQIFAKEHVGSVDCIDHIAERRIAPDPQFNEEAGYEMTLPHREQHVLDSYWPFEQWRRRGRLWWAGIARLPSPLRHLPFGCVEAVRAAAAPCRCRLEVARLVGETGQVGCRLGDGLLGGKKALRRSSGPSSRGRARGCGPGIPEKLSGNRHDL